LLLSLPLCKTGIGTQLYTMQEKSSLKILTRLKEILFEELEFKKQ